MFVFCCFGTGVDGTLDKNIYFFVVLANDHRDGSLEASCMPEQDFLTLCYADDPWHSFGVLYNFQPHQFAFTDRKGLESCKRLTIDYETTVQIVHFTALPKL